MANRVPVPVSAREMARRRRRFVLTCLAGVAIAAVAAGIVYKRTIDPVRAKEAFDAGVDFSKAARYNQAILSFDRAISLEPGFSEAYLMRGRAYVSSAQNEPAIRDFTKAIELRPDDPRPFLDRGNAYMSAGNSAAVIADCDQALRLNPKLAAVYSLRAAAVRATGKLEQAIQDFNRAIDLAGAESDYLQRGITYQMLGDHRHAISDFDQVILTEPQNPGAYYIRAKSRAALGDVKGAEADRALARRIESN